MPVRRILGGGWTPGVTFTFPELSLLVVAYWFQCSLPGPPVVKQLLQMVTLVPGQGRRFQSVFFP